MSYFNLLGVKGIGGSGFGSVRLGIWRFNASVRAGVEIWGGALPFTSYSLLLLTFTFYVYFIFLFMSFVLTSAGWRGDAVSAIMIIKRLFFFFFSLSISLSGRGIGGLPGLSMIGLQATRYFISRSGGQALDP
jgi:hypothetical protein